MNRLLIAVSAALSAATVCLAPVSAAPGPSSRTVQIVGEQKFSPDEFFTITYRFATRVLHVHSGDTVTWNNKTDDGHTVSVVAVGDIPRTLAEVNNCVICNVVLAAHVPNGFPPQGVPVLFLDDLKPSSPPEKFDSPGDSMLIAPPGQNLPTSATALITAPAGTRLNYMCTLHAWMQAQIRVVSSDEDDR